MIHTHQFNAFSYKSKNSTHKMSNLFFFRIRMRNKEVRFFNCRMQSINSLHSSINIFGVHQTNITSQFAYSKWRYPAFPHIVRNVMIVALCLINCLYVFKMNLLAIFFRTVETFFQCWKVVLKFDMINHGNCIYTNVRSIFVMLSFIHIILTRSKS